MESLDEIQQLIASISFPDDEADRIAMNSVIDAVRALDRPRTAIPMLFCWFEANSQYDLGSPGPFVHFIEEQMDYLPALESSWSRKPTPITAWMINRIANSETSSDRINHWIGLLQQASTHPQADDLCREDAVGFVLHQHGRLAA
ncbi:hypothetical protein [Pseudoxanthomonas japonensis]|uniref:hypothetical protein n=1 Tax=Pseudoxanthomonas japonensis TaxID=69284 RepID=UPI001391EC79|nr:hypothetical protein [Pseudoxanthomonas japonensis]